MKFPCSCICFFAPPGAGKTTFAAKIIKKATKKGIPCFSNFPCKFAYQFDSKDLGKYQFFDDNSPCYLFLDEAGIDFNNRNFKSFSQQAVEFMKLHRHRRVTIFLFSQNYEDFDKKMRDLCVCYFVLKKIGPLTFARKFKKFIHLNEDKQFIDGYDKELLFFGSMPLLFCWRPRYYDMFDSYSAPSLPIYDRVLWYESQPMDESGNHAHARRFPMIYKLLNFIDNHIDKFIYIFSIIDISLVSFILGVFL